MSLFLSLSLGITLATIFGFVSRVIKLPLIIGYLVAGIVITVVGLLTGEQKTFLEITSQLGITFLLFLIGLEMNIKELPWIGKTGLLIGVGQIVITSVVGFLIVTLLGYPPVQALYIAIALTFSSTVIIVKLLSEKKDLQSLYGKITIGLLLVQDLCAILILVLLSGFSTYSQITPLTLFLIMAKGLFIILVIYLLAKTVLPKIFDKVAQTPELLFVTSIAWALLVASLVSFPKMGFSIEIGGFLAGVALSSLPEHLQIASRVRPLRDFFITLFFLLLGTKLAIALTPDLLKIALPLSLFVLFGNPLIVLTIMGLLGYKKRTSFLTAVTVGQVSEFSFIIVALGERVGHIGQSIVSLVVLVGVITMTTSSYLILNSEKIYSKIRQVLTFFEKKRTRESAFIPQRSFSNHIILIGGDRMGTRLIPILQKREEPLVIIDFNPRVVQKLSALTGVFSMYGDIGDPEAIEILNIGQAKLVVSTINNHEQDLFILDKIRSLTQKPTTIFVANNTQHAISLYEKGADYVIVPSFVSGDHLAHTLNSHGTSKEYFQKLRDRDFTRFAKERLL